MILVFQVAHNPAVICGTGIIKLGAHGGIIIFIIVNVAYLVCGNGNVRRLKVLDGEDEGAGCRVVAVIGYGPGDRYLACCSYSVSPADHSPRKCVGTCNC